MTIMRKGSNKGFSLVELLIVIAIMAVLVGIMAPQLIKYFEKAKVSTDLRSLDAVYQAVIYAMNDSNVVTDPASQTEIAKLVNPVSLTSLKNNDTIFYKEVCDSLNWPDLEPETYRQYITSTHGGNATIMLQYKGGVMNPIAMWITETDSTGKKCITYAPATWTDLDDEPCIAIR